MWLESLLRLELETFSSPKWTQSDVGVVKKSLWILTKLSLWESRERTKPFSDLSELFYCQFVTTDTATFYSQTSRKPKTTKNFSCYLFTIFIGKLGAIFIETTSNFNALLTKSYWAIFIEHNSWAKIHLIQYIEHNTLNNIHWTINIWWSYHKCSIILKTISELQ